MNQEEKNKLKKYIIDVLNYNTVESYIEFNNYIEQLYLSHNIELKFPINIKMVLDLFNISYQEEKLDGESTKYGFITEKKLVINNKTTEKRKRYIMMYGIITRILNNESWYFELVYDNRFISTDPNYYPKMTLATLMLIPITLFKNEFINYLEEIEKYKSDINDKDLDCWIEKISDLAQIDQFQLISIYPILCQMISYLNHKEFENSGYDITKDNEDYEKYQKLYK